MDSDCPTNRVVGGIVGFSLYLPHVNHFQPGGFLDFFFPFFVSKFKVTNF